MVHEYGKTTLAQEEIIIYDQLVTGWKNKETRIKIDNKNIPNDKIDQIIFSATRDHPEIFWINDHHFIFESGRMGSYVETELLFQDHEIKLLEQEAERWKQTIVSKVPSSFAIDDKFWLIYDYLARQVEYKSEQIRYSHTIIGVLQKHRHKAVCEGIAKAFKYLCDALAMPSIIIVGDVNFGPGHTGPHAWNIAYTSHGPRHVDVTSQLIHAKVHGIASKDSFLHTANEMKEYTWNKKEYPLAL